MSAIKTSDIFFEKNNQIIIKHSLYRKLLEFLISSIFSVIGIGAIIVGSIVKQQSLFFRISLIILGSIILILFSESFLSILTNRIIISLEKIKFKTYFFWNEIEWDKIASIELNERSIRFRDKNNTRYVNLILKSKSDELIRFSLLRFRAKEATSIVEKIKECYQNKNKKVLLELNSSEYNPNSQSITENDISKQIPPKVEDYELEKI